MKQKSLSKFLKDMIEWYEKTFDEKVSFDDEGNLITTPVKTKPKKVKQ